MNSRFVQPAWLASAADRLQPQMDIAEQTVHCEQHPDIQMPLDRWTTVWLSRHCEEPRLVYGECRLCESERIAAENAATERQYWRRRGVPERVLHATFDNFERRNESCTKALEEVQAFVERASPSLDTTILHNGFLLLLGTLGTGKGHLAVATAKAHGRGALFITHPDLLTRLRATYGTGGTADFIDKLKEASFLILDEFGLSAGGADEATMLYQVLAWRHDRRLPTVITSNEELPRVKELLGDRLLDRIAENHRVVNIVADSYRRRKAPPHGLLP
jgi:DNA replication protein DnaC